MAVGVVGAWVLLFGILTCLMPYPIEFREGAAPVMTQFLLRGMNPYVLGNQPLGMNHYGVLYSLLVWPLAALFGNTLLIHRIVSCLFIMLAAGLIAQTILRSGQQARVAVALATLAAIALAARGGLGAFPGSMGTFLFLAALIVPFRRSFDWAGLMLSTLLSLLALYTKPYFVLALGLVIAYVFLYVSKRRAVLHTLSSAFGLLISFVLVRYIFPLYFVDVFISSFLDVVADSDHLRNQLGQISREFYPIMVLGLLVLLAAARKRGSLAPDCRHLALRWDLRRWDQALVAAKPDFFGFAALGAAAAFVLILGPVTGQYMIYVYHLILPPSLIWLGPRLRPHGRMLWAVVPLLALNLTTLGGSRLNPAFLEQRQSRDWARLYEFLSRSEAILNSPPLAAEMIRQGKWPADSGQSEYYYLLEADSASGNRVLGPDSRAVYRNGRQYVQAIRSRIMRREYDLIVLPLRFPLGDDNVIGRHYSKAFALQLNMPQVGQVYDLEIWTPSSEP